MGWGVLVFVVVFTATQSAWIAGAAGLLAYLVAVQIHPNTRCWWCQGDARRRDGTGRNWRDCFVCGGRGRRRRLLAWRRT